MADGALSTIQREGEALARTVRRYWARRGYPDIDVKVSSLSQYIEQKLGRGVSVVRSNLVGGMPPAMGGVWKPIQATFNEGLGNG